MNPWEMYGGKTEQNPWEMYQPATQKAEPQESLKRTAFDQGMQGATFGFADEISDRLGAAIAVPFTGQSYDDLYQEARNLTKERQARQFEQNPVTSIGANILGGLVTGGAGATTKAGSATGNFLRSGNTAARIGKGALAGAASGAAYGAGTSEDGERLDGAEQGAILGGITGAAIPAIGAAVSKANTRTVIPNADQIKEKASKLYQLAEQTGGEFKPEFTNQWLQKAQKSLLSDDSLINAMRSNKPLADAFEDLATFQNQPMSLSRAQALDEQLGNMVDTFVDANGNISKVGKKLLDVQRNFRSMIEGADDSMISGGREGFEALKEGRKLWATSRRLADIERILENADTYQVPATAIKTGFRRLANSSKILGYSPEEVKAIEDAARTGVVTDLMATFGSRLAPLIGMTNGPAGAVLGYGASTVSRAGATASQVSRANKAALEVAKRSGMVKTEQRIPVGKLNMIMKLPPNEARLALEKLNQPN